MLSTEDPCSLPRISLMYLVLPSSNVQLNLRTIRTSVPQNVRHGV